MANVFNAFELLKVEDQMPKSGGSKKKKSKSKSKQQQQQQAAEPEPSTVSIPINTREKVVEDEPEDGFRPAGRSGNMATKATNGQAPKGAGANKVAQAQGEPVAVVARGIEQAAANNFGPDRAELWNQWNQQLNDTKTLHQSPNGASSTFREVFLESYGLETLFRSVLLQPLKDSERRQLYTFLTCLFPSDKLVPAINNLVTVIGDLANSSSPSAEELLNLAQDAAASLATHLKTAATAAVSDGPDLSARLATARSKVIAAQRATESSVALRDQATKTGELVQALDEQMMLSLYGLSSAGDAYDQLVPVDKFVSVLSIRLQEDPFQTKQNPQILANLQQDEAMLQQQAAGITANIKALEQQLEVLRRQAAEVNSKLQLVQQRRKAILNPAEKEKNREAIQKQRRNEAQAMTGLQQLVAQMRQDSMPSHGLQANGLDENMPGAYCDNIERHLDTTVKFQAEVAERVKFLLDRLSASAKQEQHLKALNLSKELQQHTKTKDQLQTMLQDAVNNLMLAQSLGHTAMLQFQGRTDILSRAIPPAVLSERIQRINKLINHVSQVHDHTLAAVHAQ